jgi:hypothetical protein
MAEGAQFIRSTYPSSSEYLNQLSRLRDLYQNSPIPSEEFIDQFALYATPASLRRFIHFDRLYQKILELPGIIMVFGVRWGRDLSVLHGLQQIHEPMNHTRRMLGFDTFTGFPSVSSLDGNTLVTQASAYGVTDSYEKHLAQVLNVKMRLGSYAHVDRFELFKGDATEQLTKYLAKHPETVVSFAYFDLDLYEPTKACAKILLPYLASGAVIAFDEFTHPVFPGETVAARQIFGNHARFRRVPGVGPGHSSYLIFEGSSDHL